MKIAPNGPRTGWRLLIFFAILIPIGYGTSRIINPAMHKLHAEMYTPLGATGCSCTDTSDTVSVGNTGNCGNYRNCSLSSESLVTRSNTGYYRGSVVFIGTCR
jgi:hypothetical protein